MTAYPDVTNSPEDLGVQQGGNEREIPPTQSGARRAIVVCAGAALFMAAAGLWFLPSEDSETRLLKLFVSLVMVGGGAFLIHGLNEREPLPEVRIDTASRQLRIYEYDRHGRSSLSACHDIDALSELSLTERTLRARTSDGRLIVSMPLPSAAAEARLRKALSDAA